MNIFNSENFRKDQEKIQKFLSECNNEDYKKQVKILFNDLVQAIRQIDNIHSDLTLVNRLSDRSSECRNKIFETRKKIFRIISSY